ncbi:diaminopimelate epimerase [Ammonifex thiophilus]|uniref:Diaminopimelate epimerase n=1 Tax=Ammonifex thiophilus TaxID=444093 RepID=A0A3D8P4A0_9THEO|nr:diaminopimelate epimerase [Ammonifex thiophilus]RDV83982.1 diaminopimelate epimerase [Ammonifex thiophilus]
MHFVKMHGLGNDFVVVMARTLPPDTPELARKICRPHFGVGADGLVFILPSDEADIAMRIFNADGSEAEMCGNAIRCVAKLAYETRLVPYQRMRIATGAGIKPVELTVKDGKVTSCTVDMGEPVLERGAIPMQGPPGKVINEPLVFEDGLVLRVTALSFGNPHCVLFVPAVEEAPVEELGPRLEHHPAFPHRTNVEFVEVVSPSEIRVRVWERGVGETLACGSGACAAAVASFLNSYTTREVIVHLPGGELRIHWKEEDSHVYLQGPATTVFKGEWLGEE